MASSFNFKLEETDDDFILVCFEQEDSHSEKDACKSKPDKEPILDPDCIAAKAADESRKRFAVSRKYLRHRTRQFRKDSIENVVKTNVLSFLSVKSLSKFRAVSKSWDQWISNPFFIHQHTLDFNKVSGLFCQLPGEAPSFVSLDETTYGVPDPALSFLPERFDIRATSNGLLCCQGQSEHRFYYVCNPVTQQWRMLPEPSLYHGFGTGIALAFEPSMFNFGSHYQLVAVVPLLGSPVMLFEMYSSRTDSWRISEAVCCESSAAGGTIGDGIYVKGHAYWETESGFILGFDVIHESYKISLPYDRPPTSAVTEKDGRLCHLLPREVYYNKYQVEVYVTTEMELEDVISISHDGQKFLKRNGICRALCFVNEDMLIFEMEGKIIGHNVKEQESRLLSKSSTGGSTKYFPYVNSLVTVASPED